MNDFQKEANIIALATSAKQCSDKADVLKAQAKTITDTALEWTDAAQAYRDDAAQAMADGGFQEVIGPSVIVTYRKAPAAVALTDEKLLPAKFTVIPPTPDARPDKRAILAALKAGDDVPGAALKNPAPSIAIKDLTK